MNDNLDGMKLPKVNKRKQQSNDMMRRLHVEILNTIEKFEKDNDYEFEPYESDAVLLEIIQDNHAGYLRTKFGPDRL